MRTQKQYSKHLDTATHRIVRQEQDVEYEESLRADREKDLEREEELMVRETEKASEIMEMEQIMHKKENSISLVPKEPDDSNSQICHLQVKIGGRAIKRKFLLSHTMQDVYHWIFSQPDSPANFEIVTSYPKKVLYPSTEKQTLREAGLTAREVLHINDLDD